MAPGLGVSRGPRDPRESKDVPGPGPLGLGSLRWATPPSLPTRPAGTGPRWVHSPLSGGGRQVAPKAAAPALETGMAHKGLGGDGGLPPCHSPERAVPRGRLT